MSELKCPSCKAEITADVAECPNCHTALKWNEGVPTLATKLSRRAMIGGIIVLLVVIIVIVILVVR
jgi:RNA polymerase subunit RPABC4/transcription elongation factor Spt4